MEIGGASRDRGKSSIGPIIIALGVCFCLFIGSMAISFLFSSPNPFGDVTEREQILWDLGKYDYVLELESDIAEKEELSKLLSESSAKVNTELMELRQKQFDRTKFNKMGYDEKCSEIPEKITKCEEDAADLKYELEQLFNQADKKGIDISIARSVFNGDKESHEVILGLINNGNRKTFQNLKDENIN